MSDVSATLAAEARGRRWAVPLALLAALLPVIGTVGFALAFGKGYTNQPVQLIRYDQQASSLIAVSIIGAIGTALLPFPLLYLGRAVAARKHFRRGLIVLGLVGAPLLAISQVLHLLAITDAASTFVKGSPLSYQRATDLLDSTLRHVADYAGLVGTLATGGSLAVISINAMTVGLLPRFVGLIGAFAGVLTVIPILPAPLLLAFWLIGVVLVLLGRYPPGLPPAWATGEAVPWVSLSEQRERAQDAAPEDPEPAAAAPAPENGDTETRSRPAHPGAARRKRKKRR